MTTSGTTSDNEWQRVVQRMTANNKKWQWVTANDKEWWNEWIRMRASKIEWFYCNWTQIQNHLVHKWVCVCELSGCGFESSCSHLNFRFRTCFELGVFDIQVTIECGFTLKRVRDMTRTYSQSDFMFQEKQKVNLVSE